MSAQASSAGLVPSRCDLSAAEQTAVRIALRFLRARCGTWGPVAAALGFKMATLMHVVRGEKNVSATMAFRVARLSKVGVDDVLTGRFPPPGTCPSCGQPTPEPLETT